MQRLFLSLTLTLVLAGFAQADAPQCWEVSSPDHGQTFAYGSERHQQWLAPGNHLAIAMEFTNDPYVDQTQPRLYDDFLFHFPAITLGKDGHTFYYHPARGPAVAVAVRHSGFLGSEISLLPSSRLLVGKTHGLLSLYLVVSNSNLAICSVRERGSVN